LFPDLPLADRKAIAPEMRVAVLQTLKNGINRGELTEDIGVISDFIVRPRVEDIMVPDTMSQFERIAAKLNEVGIERGTNNRMLLIKPVGEVDAMLGGFIDFKLKTQKIHSISIVSLGGEVLHSQVFDSTVLKETGLNIKTKETIAKRETLLFLGFNEKGENIFKGKRIVRLIPAKLYEIPTSETPVLFTENGVVVYSNGNSTKSAWAINNGRAQIGDEQGYADNVSSQISIFAQASGKRINLSVKGKYSTEEKFDFLIIRYQDSDGSKELLKVSGKGAFDQVFSFTPKAGKLEIIFEFTSDGGVIDTGVEIESVRLVQI
jgi:hypothetical protein